MITLLLHRTDRSVSRVEGLASLAEALGLVVDELIRDPGLAFLVRGPGPGLTLAKGGTPGTGLSW